MFSSTRVTGREEETLVIYLPVKIAGAEESGGQREGDARVKVREGRHGRKGTEGRKRQVTQSVMHPKKAKQLRKQCGQEGKTSFFSFPISLELALVFCQASCGR